MDATDEQGFLIEADASEYDAPTPAPGNEPWERPDPEWYKDAVFYEVLVRAFYDPDNTGSGTLKGVEEKLDYLQWLGVDCLWLPPFYDSPLRDGGYDIRDFRKVLPEFGTVEDFVSLIDAAHKRGIRIITDFPINHTSDSHPWFQESRRDPSGPYGDFYVWSDTPAPYTDARIIFIDTEESNWTYDPVRKQYFWHRFFSHQPDLNYDNPDVQDAILDVIRFWLGLGMDGIRLDAIPYLYEREGTNCENLPETHEFIKRVRKLFDEEYPGRFLLAEANQMPDEVVQYFGDSDECQMAFHFPVMPRIFMGISQESAQPIIDILRETPDIPESAQWGIFLRNHDELTLEMVSEQERDVMYTTFATDPRMRANVGIRRRLAPLLGGHRDRLELAHALLLSLPGSPFLYYGDEIGMGDNIWLPDRDGVRTPMQWNADRNGGFSRTDPERLYLPAIRNDTYGYQAVNVESQMGAGKLTPPLGPRARAHPQAIQGLRPRRLPGGRALQPAGSRLHPRVRRRKNPLRQQHEFAAPAGRNEPVAPRRRRSARAVRQRRVPRHRRASVAGHPRPARPLVVRHFLVSFSRWS